MMSDESGRSTQCYFETKRPCRARVLCGSLAPLAADIHWNTKYLEVAYTKLRRQGVTINEDLLRHVAPLGWENIGLTGDYVWSTADRLPTGTLRPLRQRQSLLAA